MRDYQSYLAVIRQQGAAAYKPRGGDTNPHWPGTDEYREWNRGFYAARFDANHHRTIDRVTGEPVGFPPNHL